MNLCIPKIKKKVRNETFLTSIQHEVDKQRAFLYKIVLQPRDALEKTRLVRKDVYKQIINLLLTLKSRKPSLQGQGLEISF